eukprot:TRINITY_DN10978_c0_g1_i1.p2 TRINITY_DN10978_c0_g1~~TRINITY_DN10978_c0_g1_i1.p2  ORF type:complete len:132 (+),score=3.51 TRINITY_DN10978_c0_g1_i1:255-650(+)
MGFFRTRPRLIILPLIPPPPRVFEWHPAQRDGAMGAADFPDPSPLLSVAAVCPARRPKHPLGVLFFLFLLPCISFFHLFLATSGQASVGALANFPPSSPLQAGRSQSKLREHGLTILIGGPLAHGINAPVV